MHSLHFTHGLVKSDNIFKGEVADPADLISTGPIWMILWIKIGDVEDLDHRCHFELVAQHLQILQSQWMVEFEH